MALTYFGESWRVISSITLLDSKAKSSGPSSQKPKIPRIGETVAIVLFLIGEVDARRALGEVFPAGAGGADWWSWSELLWFRSIQTGIVEATDSMHNSGYGPTEPSGSDGRVSARRN